MKLGDTVYLVYRYSSYSPLSAYEVVITSEFTKSTHPGYRGGLVCLVKPSSKFDMETGWTPYVPHPRSGAQIRANKNTLYSTKEEALSVLKANMELHIKQLKEGAIYSEKRLLEAQQNLAHARKLILEATNKDLASLFTGEKYVSIFTGKEL